eukprot:5843283-Pleurochrysis_carterae.AAC.1
MLINCQVGAGAVSLAIRACASHWSSAHAPHVLRTCSARARGGWGGGDGSARQRAHKPSGRPSVAAAARVLL